MIRLSVVIDCDPGIDDAIALLAAFQAPELNIEAITVVSGNRPVDITLRNALQITELAKRSIPVYGCCWQPLVIDALYGRFHGEQGLGACQLPAPVSSAQELFMHEIADLDGNPHFDECCVCDAEYLFRTLSEVRVLTEDWCKEYNVERPHIT